MKNPSLQPNKNTDMKKANWNKPNKNFQYDVFKGWTNPIPDFMRIFSYWRYYNYGRKRKKYTHKYYTQLYCDIMNLVNFKYWFCECKYFQPYGLVIMADCKKHD